MPNMTPEEAQTLLDRLKQAGNVDDPVYAEVDDAIIPMLETIAGMRWEYALQVDEGEGWKYIGVTDGCIYRLTHPQAEELWFPTKEEAQSLDKWVNGHPVHIVRRLVSQPEEVKP